MNANIDFCGITRLLITLEQAGFSQKEIQRVAARIAKEMGADIIIFP